MQKKSWVAISIIIFLVILDQWLKVWVKTHMLLGESINIASWFRICFTENPGMAFGLEIMDKLYLTLFRIIAVAFIGWYLVGIIKKNYKTGYIICISLIFVGAIGNILDSVFYGIIFNESPYWPGGIIKPVPADILIPSPSVLFPQDGGYGSWLHGKVVDMFYFPIIDTTLPGWLPIWGGKPFLFFRPIFNLADSSICVGAFLLFIFYRRTLSKSLSKEEKPKDAK
jgi:signal peptidase II